ncbi:MAG TPA: hypothetical protein DEH78_11180, partial [Solibacterales bacterium]|nr:hypothetical protein [Bryobacterales bacterium]
ARIIEHFYVTAFSRYPTDAEKQAALGLLAKSRLSTGTPEAKLESRRQALEDTVWALLTSKEFLFNH